MPFVGLLYALFPLAFVALIILLAGGSNTFPWWGNTEVSHAYMPGWYRPHWLIAREIIGIMFMMALYWVIKRQEVSERSSEDAARFHDVATWIPFFSCCTAPWSPGISNDAGSGLA